MPDSIGQQLQKARQARGIPVEEAAQATRIRVHYLRALEDDDRESLPSSVQGRGFLRNYASFLGIQVQPLLDQWEGKSSPATEPAAPIADQAAGPTPSTRESFSGPNKPLQIEAEPSSPPNLMEPEPGAAVSPSREIFTEIGDVLRRQRELLSLSFAEVERYTKLRVHYLKAMEAGDLEHLPSMVQSRGMLNNYARFLNLDADALLNRFADALQTRRLEINPTATRVTAPSQNQVLDANGQPVERRASYPAFRRFLTMDLLAVSGVIIILVAFVIWTASIVMANQNQQKSVITAPAIGDLLAASTSPTADQGGNLISAQITPGLSTLDSSSSGPILGPTGTLPAGSPSPAVGIPTLSPGKIQLYVVARQRSWMKILVDERPTFVGRAEPGSAYPFNASQRIELITGNAGGLQVYFNQQDFGSLGNTNQVVDLVFTTRGILTPTSSPTPTQTRTPVVTATQVPSATRRPSATPQSTIPGPP